MPYTRGNAKTWLKQRNGEDGSTLADEQMNAMVLDSLAAIDRVGNFPFRRMEHMLAFEAPYNTGTVSVSAGGTAITGSGTAFTAAMVGRFIRFNGEPEQYPIFSRAGDTSIALPTAKPYLGAENLSGVSYQIDQQRVALPTNFKSCGKILYTQDGGHLERADMTLINQLRTYERSNGEPEWFGIESVEDSSGQAAPYLWVYPAPDVKRIVLFPYYKLAATPASDSAVLELPDTPYATAVLRAFLQAFLYEFQGKTDLFMAQIQKAEKLCRDTFSTMQTEVSIGQRQDPFGEYTYRRQRRVEYDPS